MEEELVRSAQKGDHDAFLALLAQHDRQIMSVIYRFSANLYDREDLYQEIFLHAWKSLKRFRFRSSFRTWLYRVSLNRCIDYMRKKKVMDDLDGEPPADSDESMEQREKIRAAHRAFSRLRGPQRICLFLYYIEGWDLRDIAGVIGCREGTVKSHLDRARRKVKKDREVLIWQTNP